MVCLPTAPRVQLSVIAGNKWLRDALRYHHANQLTLPIVLRRFLPWVM